MALVDVGASWTRVRRASASQPEFPEMYDTGSQQTPDVVLDMVRQTGGIEHPSLVVDLGAGTGLSTRPWARFAERVIGVEPNDHMRQYARRHPLNAPNVLYKAGYSHETGLPTASADIVTCAQSLHWMEPAPTFAEIARILRPGGIFAAYDREMIPTMLHWQVDAAMQRFDRAARQIKQTAASADSAPKRRRWETGSHAQRMIASCHFRHVTRLYFHHQVMGNVDDLLVYCRSLAGVNHQLLVNHPGIPALLDTLQRDVELAMGKDAFPWLYSYQMVFGIR